MKPLLLFLVCLMLQVTLLAQDSKPATDATAVADSQPTAGTKTAANSDRIVWFPISITGCLRNIAGRLAESCRRRGAPLPGGFRPPLGRARKSNTRPVALRGRVPRLTVKALRRSEEDTSE